MVATVQHVDEAARFRERIQHVCEAEDGLTALASFVAFWADYLPSIYGLAKILFKTRESDPAAAAAWADRMDALRNICVLLIRLLEREGVLAPGWTVERAAEMLWALISVQLWESLVIERDWSKEQYIERLEEVLRRSLTTA